MNTDARRSIARRAFLTKAAGIATDYLATLPSQALAHSGIPVVSQLSALANMGGAIGGLIADPEKEKNPKTDVMSLVPGVGNYRLSQRSRRVMDESNRRGARGTANLVAEAVGPITSSIVGAGAGGALGGALGSLKRYALGRTAAAPGAAVGAIAGGVLPVLIGSIAAGIRRKRTLDEQAAADTKGRAVAKYLVPGLAQYDSLKRLGASSHLDDKSKKTDKKEKKAAEAAYVEGFCKAAEAMGVDSVNLVKCAKTLGGPDPAPGLLGLAGRVVAREGVREGMPLRQGTPPGLGLAGRVVAREGVLTRQGTPWQGLFSKFPRLTTNADFSRVTKGMSRWQKILARINPAAVVQALPKAAEAAYVEGFCKAAEAMGVDPVALYKQADGVSDWVNKNLPDYTPWERLVQELQVKKDRGIDIEKYRTSNVGNLAGMLGSGTAGMFGTATAFSSLANAEEAGRLRGAKGWIRSVKKLAPGFSARHGGVAKAIGRLANTGSKTGLVAATLLPLVGGLALGGKFGQRRQVNKAIDQVQGTK